ncbi:MAG TPA: anthranilate synthase component I family protein [Kofleriaceae bacterium]|nr:anthranilate synthase component I family protein [Kofleriaceae bacterium]
MTLMTAAAAGPLDAAARLAGCRGRVLLHSARDDDGLGRWSFVAAEPRATLIARGHSLVRLDAAGRPERRFTADPFEAAADFLAEHGCRLEDLGGGGGGRRAPVPRVIGYLGYELAGVLSPRPLPSAGAGAGRDTPDLWLGAYDAVACWRGGAVEVIGEPAARARLADQLAQPPRPSLPPSFGPLVPDDAGDLYLARIGRIRDYLAAGDVYQVNLARRLVARIAASGDALAVYAAFAEVAPAPYGALLECDGVTVISGSPERFLGARGDRVETRPIKGTRPRTAGAAEELAASAKDAAEHLMIVDLERNDLGRIAETGSVTVDDLGYVVELPALYHKVSRISARPRPGVGHADLLRATFPGGSITGAPKQRAMEIIDELEPARRGPYCGALGYFGEGGALELAIAIRIGVIVGNELRVHVGGGIVADSDPSAELAETELKATGWRAALDRIARAALTPPRPLDG